MSIYDLRKEYHQRICQEMIRVKKGEKSDYLNFADGGNKSSIGISWNIAKELGYVPNHSVLVTAQACHPEGAFFATEGSPRANP